MICYRDMTFCKFYDKCKFGDTCHRALTDKVFKEARKWAKDAFNMDTAPICQFINKPECYEEKK